MAVKRDAASGMRLQITAFPSTRRFMAAKVCAARLRRASCRRGLAVPLAFAAATIVWAYPVAAQQRFLGDSSFTRTRATVNAEALPRAVGIGNSPAPLRTRSDRPTGMNVDRVPGIVGALIGGAVGAGLGAIYVQGSCESRECNAGGAGAKDGALWGAAIGATIDGIAWLKSRRDRTNRDGVERAAWSSLETVRRAVERLLECAVALLSLRRTV